VDSAQNPTAQVFFCDAVRGRGGNSGPPF
jgi:hypothetical protein